MVDWFRVIPVVIREAIQLLANMWAESIIVWILNRKIFSGIFANFIFFAESVLVQSRLVNKMLKKNQQFYANSFLLFVCSAHQTWCVAPPDGLLVFSGNFRRHLVELLQQEMNFKQKLPEAHKALTGNGSE